MKKTLLAITLCCSPTLVLAAQTPVTTIDKFNSSTTTINNLREATNNKLDVIEANRQDHVANIATKADKDKVVRVWEDFPDGGDAIAIGTPVWYDGKLYNTIQAFVKASGATPDTFTEYFEVASGSVGTNDYTLLINKPTIPTALSALSDDSSHRIVTDAEKSAWNAKLGAMPTWLPSVGPTNGRQILQAIGGCAVETYDTQATCEANAGTWTTPTYVNTSVLSGLINDAGAAADDLWSASKIIAMLSVKQYTQPSSVDYTSNVSPSADVLLNNKFITNYGASGTITITLPAVSYEISRAVLVESAQIIQIAPPSGEAFDLSGTTLTASQSFAGPATVGSKVVITRQRNAAGLWIWSADVVRGTWAGI